ncbi:MAG: sugar transferase, partial [Fibrobacteria bacterium]|nr:sugar transferase [Fibrobacteria bacterium]
MTPSIAVLFIKRSLDILVGFFGVLFFLISFPVIALLIIVDSKGGIFYCQQRVGINKRKRTVTITKQDGKTLSFTPSQDRRHKDVAGSSFTIYKYRTMQPFSENGQPKLWGKKSDMRVTRIGKWLRIFHLDELPQFINILMGD